MYEAATAVPAGESTVARLAATASRSGFDGLVVRNFQPAVEASATREDADGSGYAEAVASEFDVDLVRAATVAVDSPDSASGHVGTLRPQVELLLVQGGSPRMNRFAVESERVDVLTAPMRADGDVNHVLVKAAVEHGVRLEFDLTRVLRASGGPRVRAIQSLRKLRELVAHYDAPYVVSGHPRSHLQVRAGRELVAVGEAVGFDAEQVREGLAEWGRLAARNRERVDDSFVAPGVRRGRYADTGGPGGGSAGGPGGGSADGSGGGSAGGSDPETNGGEAENR